MKKILLFAGLMLFSINSTYTSRVVVKNNLDFPIEVLIKFIDNRAGGLLHVNPHQKDQSIFGGPDIASVSVRYPSSITHTSSISKEIGRFEQSKQDLRKSMNSDLTLVVRRNSRDEVEVIKES